MVNFNRMPCIYWSNTSKISYLQRMIIIWSIMYYEHNESCVTDKFYDSVSYQLVELQNEATKDEFEKSMYYYAMYDFDGSTGFDIPSRLTEKDNKYLTHLAYVIYNRWKSQNEKLSKGVKRNDKTK